MSPRSLLAVAAAVVAAVLLCAGGVGALLGGTGAAACGQPPTGTPAIPHPSGSWPAVGRWDPQQVGHAATTVTTGACAVQAGPQGWVQPVRGPVVSGFRTPARPGHDGVDIAAPRGTVIRAASAGVVVRARCNIAPAWWGCDRDGDPQAVRGCGWYVDLRHGPNLYTRYCHMATQPIVHTGQAVSAGQPIGLVGSSGHSSGPHLHYEVHIGPGAGPDTAVDPETFMRERQAPLG